MQPEEVPAGEHGPEANYSSFSGSVIGHILHERFLVERDLTDPSFGEGLSVFLVKDLKEYCREALLKISRPAEYDSGAPGPSFREVSDQLSQLRHPNIEEILETGRLTDGRPFAVTKPYPATALDRLIAPAKRLELEGVAQLVEQIADALAAVHAKGILHCDLRPSNILVPAGDIGAKKMRLINFGTAWPVDVRGESLANVRPGHESLHYAAPELLVRLGHRSECSDIYSLAVLVYRLVTGTVPYAAHDRAGLLEAINAGSAKQPTESRTDLSDEAAALIMAGLQFEPAWRPQEAEDFGLRLVRFLRPPKGTFVELVEVPPEVEVEAHPASPVEPLFDPHLEVQSPILVVAKSSDTRAPVSDRAVAWSLIILLMAGALSIPIGQTLFKKESQAAAIETIVNRPAENGRPHKLRFWFEPRNEAGPQPDQASFAGGVAGQLAFVSEPTGQVYIFSEFTGEDGRPAYRVTSPSPGLRNRSRQAESEKQVMIVTPEQDGQPQPRAVWLIWTAIRNDDLESLGGSAKDGVISNDEDRRKLRHFLERNRNLRVKTSFNESTRETVLESPAERIVYRIAIGEVLP